MMLLRLTFAILVLLTLALGSFVGGSFIPASVWFEPIGLKIVQVNPGETPQIEMERSIHFTFFGSYTVDVRDFETNALKCGAGTDHKYKAGLSGKYSLPLDEFAGGDSRCKRLPDGVYTAETCWTVKYPVWGWLPPKTVCITSNPFRVTR